MHKFETRTLIMHTDGSSEIRVHRTNLVDNADSVARQMRRVPGFRFAIVWSVALGRKIGDFWSDSV